MPYLRSMERLRPWMNLFRVVIDIDPAEDEDSFTRD